MQALRRHALTATKFAGVGVVNTAVDFGVFLVLHALGLLALGANLGAFICANGLSYLLNARFTFRTRSEKRSLSAAGYMKFASVHLTSLAISTGFIAAFADAVGALAAKILAAGLTLIWNYVASALFVFRKKPATGGKA
ncbi:MAG: GtrA family protein [Parvularculaceae bacterium]